MIDPAPITTFVVFALSVLTIGFVVGTTAMVLALRESRRDRVAHHESISTYYGRLHLAH